MASLPAVAPEGTVPSSVPCGCSVGPGNIAHKCPRTLLGGKLVSTDGDHATIQNKDHP